MSASYQRNIQDDFDDDGAEAMEYEPSEKSLDQKSLLDEIPEPCQYENTNETYDPSQNGFPQTSHFGPDKMSHGGYYSNGDNSQNISSSFLNLSDSDANKADISKNMNEGSLETAANMDTQSKHNFDNIQELKQQVVELKRQISLKDQDLMYCKQRNEKLTNEVNSYKSGSSAIPNQNLEHIRQENQFLREKCVDSEAKIAQMEEYIKEVIEDTEEGQLMQLLKKEKEINERLQEEKNQLLEYVESSLEEQENVTKYIESLKEENAKLKQEGNSKLRSSSNADSDYIQHFDTFGGEGDDTLVKQKLQEAQETIEKLQEQMSQLEQTRQIENKSKNTDIENLTEKLRIAESDKETGSRAISDFESHFKSEIEDLKSSLKKSQDELLKTTNDRDQAQVQLKTLEREYEEIVTKLQKMKDNYTAMENTCNETQTELEELREKYDQEVAKTANHEEMNEYKINLEQAENERDALKNLNKQQTETIQSKTKKVEDLTEQIQELNAQIRELENEVDKLSREKTTLNMQLEQSKNVTESPDYVELLEKFTELREEMENKDVKYKEMKHDFSKKLNEFQQMSHDYNECKHALQDLKYGYNNLEAQKKEKDERLKQMSTKNDTLTEELQAVKEKHKKKSNSEIEEANQRVREAEDDNRTLQKILKINRDKANECARLVDEFNESFLNYAKEDHFDKKLISRKYRDFMILTDKIKPAKQSDQIQDVMEKVEEWVLQSAEEFEIQMKNAATFKRKYLQVSERVDQLEDYQMNITNEEKRRHKREEELKKEINTLNAKLGQVESEKSCSYKREDKSSKQLHNLKQDLKAISKENQRLISQMKAVSTEKDRLKLQLKDNDRMKGCESEKIKDLEHRIFHLLYEKDSIMDMLNTLERSIPSTEVQRLFSEYINNQKEMFDLEDNKNKLENELLTKEKELRGTAKEEQLSPAVINLRKDIEIMRKELADIENIIEETKLKLSSLKDELHCVEIHEKRRNEVIFETERTLLEKREENETLKRELNYLSTSKTDIERAYHAVVEEKKIIDRELMMLKVKMNHNNTSEYHNKPNILHSTMNPGDYSKNKIWQSNNHTYSSNMGGNETSSYVSPEIGHKFNSFYPNQSRGSNREDITEQYESEEEERSEDQIIEQSYETESNFGPGEELSIQDKLKQVKDAFNSIKSSIHLKNN
ncbi:unnamed protein product [Moneuplotes crassus]|uniref:Uncharacterized protein n=1 Tax=Euplotes crassus TaxID=5936 RepID=A0AAD1XJ62_EUPCR|nr:unnamed protein product [Moneuplotes crassus]